MYRRSRFPKLSVAMAWNRRCCGGENYLVAFARFGSTTSTHFSRSWPKNERGDEPQYTVSFIQNTAIAAKPAVYLNGAAHELQQQQQQQRPHVNQENPTAVLLNFEANHVPQRATANTDTIAQEIDAPHQDAAANASSPPVTSGQDTLHDGKDLRDFLSAAFSQPASTNLTAAPAHAFPAQADSHSVTRSQPRPRVLPIPLELMPPRRTPKPHVSLLSNSRTSPPTPPAPFSPPLVASDPSRTAVAGAATYSSLFRDSFVNPFNGRLTPVTSPTSKLLFKVGFYRSLRNPLHLEWSPTDYIVSLQKVLEGQRKHAERCQKLHGREERRQMREARAAKKRQRKRKVKGSEAAAEAEAEEGMKTPEADQKSNNSNGEIVNSTEPSTEPSTASAELSSADDESLQESRPSTALSVMEGSTRAIFWATPLEEMVRARQKLLRPLRRLGPEHWMSSVANLLERQDVFTYLNKEVERLYDELGAGYVPPKLDCPVDQNLSDIQLTKDQQHVMNLTLRGYSIFVGGSAGTGKTILLKTILRALTQLGLRVAMTATTGVAAVQLGGCTFHHAFNAPVTSAPHRWDANALRAVDAVIIDEVSLLDACMLDAFDMEARLARMNHVPFGGLQVIVCGDFLQLSRDDTLPAYESAAFKHLVAVKLVTPLRHSAGDPLLRLLEELRHGEFNAAQFQALDRAIPENVTHLTYIFPRRREAQQLNETKLCELDSREMTFTPQRGPLQLCGSFTGSALIEIQRDANGMRSPLPRREQLLDMLYEEAHRLRTEGSRGCKELPHIADHEMVLMPARVGSGDATRFILRLRCRDQTAAARTAKAVAAPSKAEDSMWGTDNHGATASLYLPDFVASPDAAAAAAALINAPLSRSITAPAESAAEETHMTTILTHRQALALSYAGNRRGTAPFSPPEWEKIAAAVAKRLGGRLLEMLPVEPASMVPLSVSMTLADMTSPDIAHSLTPLRLKLGCRVMVNRNLSRTVSNGSVGLVEAFAPPDISLFPRRTDRAMRGVYQRLSRDKLFDQLPIVRLLSGEVVQIPPVSLLVGGTAQSYYYGHEVLTIPLQLGYAFTVHKVQGLTLQGTVVVDCAKFFDCPHLIYVACSRVRRMDQLVVRHVEPRMIIVRRSALEFSDSLQEACDINNARLPANLVRAAWSQRTAQRIFTVAD